MSQRRDIRSFQSLYSSHESGEMDIELSVLSVSLDCYCVLGNQSNIKTGGKTKVFEMAEVFVSAFVFRYCMHQGDSTAVHSIAYCFYYSGLS